MGPLVPDIVYRPSSDVENLLASRGTYSKVRSVFKTLSLDPSITDIEMRIKQVRILNNQEFIGTGDIYIVVVAVDDLSKKPITMQVKTFEGVRNNDELTLGPAGLAVYRNPKGQIPRFLDYRLIVMESDQEKRDFGKLLADVEADTQFKSVRDGLIAMATATQPAAALVIAAADTIVNVISRVLKADRDDQVIYIAGSFNDKIDDLGVKLGPITQKNRNAIVTYQVMSA